MAKAKDSMIRRDARRAVELVKQRLGEIDDGSLVQAAIAIIQPAARTASMKQAIEGQVIGRYFKRKERRQTKAG